MTVATGSLAFIGAARFQGTWDADANTGVSKPSDTAYSGLLTSATYDGGGNLTAAATYGSTPLAALGAPKNGDYWQISNASSTPSENTTIDSINDWEANDWIIYSGSQWIKLSYQDTIASVVTGDINGAGATWNFGKIIVGRDHDVASNVVTLFHSGSDGDDGLLIVREDLSTVDTNLLGGIGFDSTDGNVPSTVTEASAFIAAYAAEHHSATAKGGELVFGTTTVGQADDTTSSEWVRITDTGYVGIGTSNPQDRLHLETTGSSILTLSRHDSTIEDGNTLAGIQFDGTENGSTYAAGPAGVYAVASEDWNVGSAEGTKIQLWSTPNGATAPSHAMTIAGTKIGIVQSNPTHTLDVLGDINLTGELSFDGGSVVATSIKDEDTMSSDSDTALATQQSIKAYVDATVTAQDLDFQGDSGGTLSIDLDSETLDIAGGTGVTTTGSGNTITVATDADQGHVTSVGTLTTLAVTGDLTVDTNTLFVDASEDKVGIGVSDPDTTLEVLSTSAQLKLSYDSDSYATMNVSAASKLTVTSAETGDIELASGGSIDLDSAGAITLDSATNTIKLVGTGSMQFLKFSRGTGGSAGALIEPATLNEDLIFQDFNGSNEIMRIDTSARRVGIGTDAPGQLLHVATPNDGEGIKAENTSTGAAFEAKYISGAGHGYQLKMDDNNNSTTIFLRSYGNSYFNTGGSFGIGTASPDSSAILELSSTTKGFLLPRLTTTQRDAVSSPAEGLVVYNDSTNALNFYNGSSWQAVGTGGGAVSAINNATENELVTIGSTTTELDAEANLTYDGTTLTVGGHILPGSDNDKDLGSAAKRWANIYTGDLHLKNERGDWTIIEEEEFLSITNNKNGKRYKFVLEELE